MKARGTTLGTLCCLALVLFAWPPCAAGQQADLQTRFDRELNSVRKAKLLEKLGESQFEAVRQAEKAGDNSAAGLTLEKYRDNVRAALEALKKQHPNAEKQPNGYRQLEIQARKGIREIGESLLVAPEPFKPPLEIVREDLAAMDDELLKLLFPNRPLNKKAATPLHRRNNHEIPDARLFRFLSGSQRFAGRERRPAATKRLPFLGRSRQNPRCGEQ